MTATDTCPACASWQVEALYRVDDVPVQSCVLLDTVEEAHAFPRGDIELKFCSDCGFIFNAIFELARVDYAATTEESQHFSGTFTRFAERLVEDIASRYDLAEKRTLEIGCGKGDFLEALVARTGTRAVGVDPGYRFDRAQSAIGAIDFRKEYFSPDAVDASPDFIVCRHTLEHVPAAAEFVNDVQAAIRDRSDVALLFETPDAYRVLSEGAFWDIYYEHCSYFTLGSHARLFRRAGFDVTSLNLDYGDQYIIQYARPGNTLAYLHRENDLAEVSALVKTFPGRVSEAQTFWRDFVRSRHQDGKRVALWGGGSKAVSFLTTQKLVDEVAGVVDINPHKQGRFLPGTGHEVLPPTRLMDLRPDTVIVMNAIYETEIRAQLATMGLAPELVSLK
ncbi:MAG: class I SAM-dependent methyltransferase [Devosia sp.]